MTFYNDSSNQIVKVDSFTNSTKRLVFRIRLNAQSLGTDV